jgi:nucleoid-associated protein YgaU
MPRLKTVIAICAIALLALVGAGGPAYAATTQQAPAAQTAGSIYTVQRGDTLSSIAQRAYGNANAWPCIWAANSWIMNPSYLIAGWQVALPASGSCGGGSSASPTPRPSATPVPSTGTTYVVQRGDSLVNIAYRTYGNPNAWQCIWAANRWIVNPSYIQPGWTILLPPSGACGGGAPPPATATPVPPTATPAPPTATAAPPAATATPTATRTHIVAPGESLSQIACMYYADCNYWRIYNANRDKIWNVNYILPGTVLRIP